LEAKVRESDLIGIIGEADAALVSDTILLSVNDKLVQMAICATHDHLHGFVKCPDGRVMRNQDASPNCWLNVFRAAAVPVSCAPAGAPSHPGARYGQFGDIGRNRRF